MVSISGFKFSSIEHYLYFVNYGPIKSHTDQKAGEGSQTVTWNMFYLAFGLIYHNFFYLPEESVLSIYHFCVSQISAFSNVSMSFLCALQKCCPVVWRVCSALTQDPSLQTSSSSCSRWRPTGTTQTPSSRASPPHRCPGTTWTHTVGFWSHSD